MRLDIRLWITAGLCAVVVVGCGGQHRAHHPKPDSSTSLDDDDDESTSELAPESERADGSDNRGLAKICEKLGQRATKKCTKKMAGLYQESCRHYLKDPGKCEKEIRDVLKCQFKASDELLCAHQADPNCSQVNRDLKICQTGSAPEEQTTTEEVDLPPGWETVRDSQLGFRVAMPPGAALDPESKRRTWFAEERGIKYYVAEIDPPSGKLSNAVYVRTVIAYVGSRCQRRLKLHGELETKGTTVVQYDSACPDGTEWHGMLHFWNGKAVSTGFHAPAGAEGVLEPYFYSFSIAK